MPSCFAQKSLRALQLYHSLPAAGQLACRVWSRMVWAAQLLRLRGQRGVHPWRRQCRRF